MNYKEFIQTIQLKYRNSKLVQRIVNGAFWSLCGTSIAKLIVLIAGIVCARILGKEAYGEFGIVRSTITMFIALGGAGLGATATKYIAEYRSTDINHVPSVYILTNLFAILFGLIVSLLVFVFSDLIAINMLHAEHLSISIKIGSLLLFVSVLSSAQNGVLSGFEDFKNIAINTFIGGVFESIFMLLGAKYYGVNGAVLGFGMGFLALLVANFASIQRNFHKLDIIARIKSLRKDDIKLLYRFSLPAALASLVVPPTYWIMKSMLVRFDGFGELALYEAADHWRLIILFIPTAVGNIILPILSSTNATEPNKFWKLLKTNMLLNASIAFIVSIVICALSKNIMLLYGEDYNNYYPLVVLAISTVFSSIANVVGLSISSRAKMWTGFGFNILWGCMVVGFSYLFLSMGYGALALSMAILFSYIIHTTLQLLYLVFSMKKSNSI